MQRTAVGYQTIRDEEVRYGTGKGWQEWCALLDAAQVDKNVTSLVRYLCASQNIDQVWAQVIAVYYKWRV